MGTFYHASYAKLSPGDLVVPGRPANFSDRPSGFVFFTGCLESAEFWESFLGGESMAEQLGFWPDVYRYEVEPTGSYERDDHPVNDGLKEVWLSESPLKVIRLLEVFPG
jgi:hypothetical protein